MRIAYSLSCVAALTLISVPALSTENALQLVDLSGKVLVTSKNGVAPAKIGQSLESGARVFVGEGATARVTSFDGSCDVTLPSEKVTVINRQKLCDVQITPTAIEGGGGGLPPPVVGLAFFGAAAAVVGISIATSDNDDPISTP
jgi:hypothetical protein